MEVNNNKFNSLGFNSKHTTKPIKNKTFKKKEVQMSSQEALSSYGKAMVNLSFKGNVSSQKEEFQLLTCAQKEQMAKELGIESRTIKELLALNQADFLNYLEYIKLGFEYDNIKNEHFNTIEEAKKTKEVMDTFGDIYVFSAKKIALDPEQYTHFQKAKTYKRSAKAYFDYHNKEEIDKARQEHPNLNPEHVALIISNIKKSQNENQTKKNYLNNLELLNQYGLPFETDENNEHLSVHNTYGFYKIPTEQLKPILDRKDEIKDIINYLDCLSDFTDDPDSFYLAQKCLDSGLKSKDVKRIFSADTSYSTSDDFCNWGEEEKNSPCKLNDEIVSKYISYLTNSLTFEQAKHLTENKDLETSFNSNLKTGMDFKEAYLYSSLDEEQKKKVDELSPKLGLIKSCQFVQTNYKQKDEERLIGLIQEGINPKLVKYISNNSLNNYLIKNVSKYIEEKEPDAGDSEIDGLCSLCSSNPLYIALALEIEGYIKKEEYYPLLDDEAKEKYDTLESLANDFNIKVASDDACSLLEDGVDCAIKKLQTIKEFKDGLDEADKDFDFLSLERCTKEQIPRVYKYLKSGFSRYTINRIFELNLNKKDEERLIELIQAGLEYNAALELVERKLPYTTKEATILCQDGVFANTKLIEDLKKEGKWSDKSIDLIGEFKKRGVPLFVAIDFAQNSNLTEQDIDRLSETYKIAYYYDSHILRDIALNGDRFNKFYGYISKELYKDNALKLTDFSDAEQEKFNKIVRAYAKRQDYSKYPNIKLVDFYGTKIASSQINNLIECLKPETLDLALKLYSKPKEEVEDDNFIHYILSSANKDNLEILTQLCDDKIFMTKVENSGYGDGYHYQKEIISHLDKNTIPIFSKMYSKEVYKNNLYLMSSILNVINKENIEFAKMLVNNATSNRNYGQFSAIIRVANKENIEVAKMLCFDKDLNLTVSQITAALGKINNNSDSNEYKKLINDFKNGEISNNEFLFILTNQDNDVTYRDLRKLKNL